MLDQIKRKRILGFTAVEITMVATVIAILALLVLPLFRKRTEEAKKTAAMDDLQSLMKALILVNADADQWFRLQDLDNTMVYNSPPQDAATEVPVAVWNRAISAQERQSLSSPDRWQGPYIAFAKGAKQNYETYSYFNTWKPFLFKSSGGPIFDGSFNLIARQPVDDKIPKDPWGNPYLFFGPGKLGKPTEGWGPASQSNYGHAVIYCLGPNGFPGNNEVGASNASSYFREAGFLGEGDDMSVVF